MTPKFPTATPSLHTALRTRVNEYFDERGLEIKGNATLYAKAAIILAAVAVLYAHVVFFTPVWYLAIAECILLGLFISGIGFNIMHDGSHGSFSQHKWMNVLASASLECLGGSAFMWKMKHCTIHHTFTNVEGVDDDIDIGNLMRVNEHQTRHWMHRFQHLYFWFLYMMFYVSWIFFTDYEKYFSRRIGSVKIARMKRREHVKFWAGKLLNFCIYMAVPIAFVGFKAWVVGFLAMGFTTGLTTSLVFQLAHTVEHTDFPLPDIDGNMLPDEFAVHQIATTANFATRSRLVTWAVGGLNFQIEHHLFPHIAHVHYPAISKIVRDVCREREIDYVEHETFHGAVAAHVRHLRAMGTA